MLTAIGAHCNASNMRIGNILANSGAATTHTIVPLSTRVTGAASPTADTEHMLVPKHSEINTTATRILPPATKQSDGQPLSEMSLPSAELML